MIFCVCAGLVLSMNTATMDGSRALYGIAKDGMTIRQFGKLNRFRVPALAMTVDALLNILLISFFNNPIEIIAVSNIGYVFATCAALSGFLLLRKDRPNWPRPVHLSSLWVPLGAVLLAANFTFLIVGGFIYSGGFLGIEGYGYGWDKTRWGLLVLVLALFLYWFRHAVQDKTPIKWREEVPATPEEQQAHPGARGRRRRRPSDPGAADAHRRRGPAGPRRRSLRCIGVRVLALADKRPPLDPALMAEQTGRRRRASASATSTARGSSRSPPCAARGSACTATTTRPTCCARSRSRTCTGAARRSAG